eukprot:jgi/Botrbrau1/20831/Bobra.0156s0056.1
MVFFIGKFLALAAVSGVAFFIIQRPRIPIIPPCIPVEALRKSSKNKNRNADHQNEQINRQQRSSSQEIISKPYTPSSKLKSKGAVNTAPRDVEAYLSKDVWASWLWDLREKCIAPTASGSYQGRGTAGLYIFAAVIRDVMAEMGPAELLSAEASSIFQEKINWANFSDWLRSLMNLFESYLNHLSHILGSSMPVCQQISAFEQSARKKPVQDLHIAPASVLLTIRQIPAQVYVELHVTGEAPQKSISALHPEDDWSQEDWVFEDRVSIDFLPDEMDEWLDVSVGTCKCLGSGDDLEKRLPNKSNPDLPLAAKPVELHLRFCEAQEQVAVEIQLASEGAVGSTKEPLPSAVNQQHLPVQQVDASLLEAVIATGHQVACAIVAAQRKPVYSG